MRKKPHAIYCIIDAPEVWRMMGAIACAKPFVVRVLPTHGPLNEAPAKHLEISISSYRYIEERCDAFSFCGQLSTERDTIVAGTYRRDGAENLGTIRLYRKR